MSWTRSAESSKSIVYNDTFFKIKPNCSYSIPRESYLKRHFANLTANFAELDFEIVPYQGEKKSNDASRRNMHSQLNSFWLLSQECVPDMKNGHYTNKHLINRALIVKSKNSDEMIGAIYFIINLEERSCIIKGFEIDESCRGNNLGSYLLHIAIFTSALYGSTKINTFALGTSVPFYKKHGFINENFNDPQINPVTNKYEYNTQLCSLDLHNPHCVSILMSRMQKWMPISSIEHLKTTSIDLTLHDEKERIAKLIVEPITDQDIDMWIENIDAGAGYKNY